jgi:hypothetical protein
VATADLTRSDARRLAADVEGIVRAALPGHSAAP